MHRRGMEGNEDHEGDPAGRSSHGNLVVVTTVESEGAEQSGLNERKEEG
jgi:hypothetical protein